MTRDIDYCQTKTFDVNLKASIPMIETDRFILIFHNCRPVT